MDNSFYIPNVDESEKTNETYQLGSLDTAQLLCPISDFERKHLFGFEIIPNL